MPKPADFTPPPQNDKFPPPSVEPLSRSGAVIVYGAFALIGALVGSLVTWALIQGR